MGGPGGNARPEEGLRGRAERFGQGVWAIADQGLASAGTFLANVLLARALSAVEYGAFTVAYQSFAFLMMIHASAIAEPLMVFAAGKYFERREAYLRVVLVGQLGVGAVALALGAATAAAMAALGHAPLAAAYAGIAVAAPAMLTAVALRRVAFARFEGRMAVAGGAANLVLVLAGLLALQVGGGLGVFSACLALGFAAALVDAGLWRSLVPGSPLAGPRSLAREIARDHRSYGRWGVAAGAAGWVPGNVFYLLLPLLPGAEFGLQATATLRALVNLVMPVLQANAALGSVLIPDLSARRREGLRSGVGAVATLLIGASAAYGAGLVVFGAPLLDWLYAGRYPAPTSLLLVLALVPVLSAGAHVLRGSVVAEERPDLTFWANLAAAAAALGAGLPLALHFGIHGVLAAMVLGPAMQAAVLGVQAARRRR